MMLCSITDIYLHYLYFTTVLTLGKSVRDADVGADISCIPINYDPHAGHSNKEGEVRRSQPVR